MATALGGRSVRQAERCARAASLAVTWLAVLACGLTLAGAVAQAQGTGTGGGGNNSNAASIACNGQPVSLKLCKPGNRACLTAAIEPVVQAAAPAGVPATPNNQITYTGVPASGATIEYKISVPNIGTVGAVTQNSPSTGVIDVGPTTFSVPIGGSQTLTFNATPTGGTVTHAIEIDRQASGFAVAGYTASCTPKPTSGTLKIIKTSIGGGGAFAITVTGPGGATTVPITTSGTPNGSGSADITLAPGSYSVTETAPTGWALTGVACVKTSGTGSASGSTVALAAGDKTTCTVTNTKQVAGLTFTKTANTKSFGAIGQPIGFTLKIANTGADTLSNVSISDPGTTLVGCDATTLLAGSVATCTATRNATAADLKAGRYDNTAVLTATRPDGSTATVAAAASVPAVIGGGLALTASATPETFSDVGQTITYTFVARNTSGIAIDGVTLSVPGAVISGCAPSKLPGVLAPSATTTCTATHVTTLGDINGACRIANATLTGIKGGAALTTSANARSCMTADKTSRAIGRFIARRVDLLAANEPDSLKAIRRFRQHGRAPASAAPVDVTGDGDDGNGSVSVKTSLSQILGARAKPDASGSDTNLGNTANGDSAMRLGGSNTGDAEREEDGTRSAAASPAATPPPFDIWIEANYQRWRDRDDTLGRSGDLAVATLGADVTIAPGLIVGALLQTDFMTDHSDDLATDINGNGWMAGPYIAMQLSEHLYLDARAAYGQSDNTIKPFATYTDHFETDRFLARATLTGSWNIGALRITPSAGLIYIEETQSAYVDTLGLTVAEQSAKLGRLTFGPEVAYAIPLGDGGSLEPHAALTGMWDFEASGQRVAGEFLSRSDDLRMKVEGGVTYHGPEGASLRAALSYDGIGSDDVKALGGQLSVNVPLEQLAALVLEGRQGRAPFDGISYAGATAAEPAADASATAETGADSDSDEAPAYELPTVVVETEKTQAPKPARKKTAKRAPVEATSPKPSSAQKSAKSAKAKSDSPPAGTEPAGGTASADATGAATAADLEAAATGTANTAAGTGQTASRRIVEQVASVSEITAKEIAQRGASTLDEAIDLVPGVYVRNAADGVPRIDIRGLRTRNIQLLLDGVPLNSTFDGQFDPRSIPVENIAKIKITKGGSSVLYGPGGNAAVIDIVTKSAAAGLHGSGQVQYSPERGTEERVTASYGTKTVRVFMSASALNQNAFDLSDDFTTTPLQGDGARINSDRKDQALYGNLAWTPSAIASFGMSVNWRTGEYGKPTGTRSRDESPFAQRTRFERVEDFDNLSIQSSGAIRLGPAVSIRPIAYYNRFQEITDNYDDLRFATQVRANATHEDAITEIGGGGAQTIFKQGASQLTVALDGHNESWQSSGFQVPCAITAADGQCSLDGAATPYTLDHDIQVFS
ncbi:MAG: DUF7507 domain-containing protein, partial [Hyphomicrobium sp.]